MKHKAGQFQRKDFAFKAESVADDGTFKGYGSVFGNVDSYGEIVESGAFADSLKRIAKSGDPLPALWQHSGAAPIGGFDTLAEDDRGLKASGFLMIDDVALAREAHALMKRRVVKGLSIGYYVEASSYNEKTGIRTLQRLDLQEISIVTFPANAEATIDSVKAMQRLTGAGSLPSLPDFEAFLREAGFSKTEATLVAGRGLRELLSRREAGGASSDAGEKSAEVLAALRSFSLPTFTP